MNVRKFKLAKAMLRVMQDESCDKKRLGRTESAIRR
jgi:hypothetical protein